MSESFREQLRRVEMMADWDDTWDLSDNDLAALKAVLADRQRMAAKLNSLVELRAVPRLDEAEIREHERMTLVAYLENTHTNEPWVDAATDAIASAPAVAERRATPQDSDDAETLRRALGNCYMMAKREIARILNGKSQTDATSLERWRHVHRFARQEMLPIADELHSLLAVTSTPIGD